MPDYTKINFADIEDSAAGRDYDIEARFGRQHIESEHLGITQFRFSPGTRPPFGHRHRELGEVDDEVPMMSSGKLDARALRGLFG